MTISSRGTFQNEAGQGSLRCRFGMLIVAAQVIPNGSAITCISPPCSPIGCLDQATEAIGISALRSVPLEVAFNSVQFSSFGLLFSFYEPTWRASISPLGGPRQRTSVTLTRTLGGPRQHADLTPVALADVTCEGISAFSSGCASLRLPHLTAPYDCTSCCSHCLLLLS